MQKLYQIFTNYPRICTDTRAILPDSIFFCLKGANFDGNQFVEQALEAGVAYVVTETEKFATHPQCLMVDDALLTLQQLSLYHRKQLQIPVVGITGSNGKTTTKELIVAVLSKKYRTACTQGNLNNHIGVPLTLLSIKKDDEIAVIEMGANHIGEIAELCAWALPTHGIITNIGKAHLEGFISIENIIKTKKAIFESVLNNQGTIFINESDENILSVAKDLLQENSKTVCYGGKEALFGEKRNKTPRLSIDLWGRTIQTNLTGDYNLINFLCAGTVGKYFGVTEDDICCALETYTPSNHRSQIIEQGTNTIIADFYNANPSSMKAALDNFAQIAHHKKIVLLGEMFELGEATEKEHQNIRNICRTLEVNAFYVGNAFNSLTDKNSEKEKYFHTVEEVNTYFQSHPLQDTLILIKGSRGVHLENVIGGKC